MKTTLSIAILSVFSVTACGDDSGGSDDNPMPLGEENRPSVGAQIDRTGRPAINTALNFTFIPDENARDDKKDQWNQAGPNDWDSFIPEMRVHLMVLDALDEECGDQVAYGTPASGDEYLGLATLLADDQIWVNGANGNAGAYLGLELGLADQGGRRPNDDVVDISYAGLAGTIDVGPPLTLNFGDTINANDKTNPTEFPYLAAP